MRKMPRLVSDIRRRNAGKRFLRTMFLCLLAYCGCFAFAEYSKRLKAEGEKLLDEIGELEDCLSGGAVERIVNIRRRLGQTVSQVNKALGEERFRFDGDIYDIARTREDERENEARSYVTLYRTSMERSGKIAECLKSEISTGGRKSEFESRIVRIEAADASPCHEKTVAEMKKDKASLERLLRFPVVPPFFYHMARDRAEDALSRARKAVVGVGWLRELSEVERDAGAFCRELAAKIEEMRKCDNNAKIAVENLLAMPFGGGRVLEKCLADLESAEKVFAESGRSGLEIVQKEVAVFGDRTRDLEAGAREALCSAESLRELHGASFVKDESIERLRGIVTEFAEKCESAANFASSVASRFKENLDARNVRFKDVEQMRERLKFAKGAKQDEIESVCKDAAALAREIGESNLAAAISKVKKQLESNLSLLEAEAKAVDSERRVIDALIPDWNSFSENMLTGFSDLRANVDRISDEAKALDDRLSRMTGPGRKVLDERLGSFSKRAVAYNSSLPTLMSCSNGREAAKAEALFKKRKSDAGRLSGEFDEISAAFKKAADDGLLVEVVYEQKYQDWTFSMVSGTTDFKFALLFDKPGPHKIEIVASKSRGKLYKPDLLARSIELGAKITDPAGKSFSGVLAFGNTVEEKERTLMSCTLDAQPGYQDMELKLSLKYKSRELSGQSMSDWDPEKLNLVLKIDGVSQDTVWIKDEGGRPVSGENKEDGK